MKTTETGGNENKIKKKKKSKKTMNFNNINSLLLFEWELIIKLLRKFKNLCK